MAVLLFLCVFCQTIITASFGATLPFISLEAGVLPIQPLSSSATGCTQPLSPKVPSRATDILTKYLNSCDSGKELPSPSSPTSITLPSLPPVPSRASDILSNYLKSKYSENVSSSTGRNQLPSPKIPTKATDVLYEYFKTQYPMTDCSLSSKTSLQTEPIKIKSTSSVSLPPPSKLCNANAFSTVSCPSSLPVVDVFQTSPSETYQPIYPPVSTLLSPNSLTYLPAISSNALKINYQKNPSYTLPHPLQYRLQSLPKVAAPPVTAYPNQQLLPKLYPVFNDKSKSFNLKTAPKVPLSTNTCLKPSNIEHFDQTLTTDPINPSRNQLVINPVEPFPIKNLEILPRKTRPIVTNNMPIISIDKFDCKLNHNGNDGIGSININPNLPEATNTLRRYYDDIETPNVAEIPIPIDAICTQSITDIMTDVSPILYYIPSYTQIIPTNYFNVCPVRYFSTTSASSSVDDILSNIVFTYLPYLISTRRKPRKSVKVLPLNPYSASKRIQTSPIPSINPKLIFSSQATNNQLSCPLEISSTFMPSTMNSPSIDATSLYYDLWSPYYITYSPDITTPAQVTPLVPLTVTWVAPGSSQHCSHSLPSAFQQSYSELSPPFIVEPIAQVKSLDKSKAMERLLEFVCLAELFKGKGSVDWNAIDMALTLLSAIG